MRPVQLPDCSARRDELVLSPRQQRELVRVLAEEGTEGLERWLDSEQQRDPRIRERIEAARERIERMVRSERSRLQAAHATDKAAAESRWERRLRETAEREARLRERLGIVRERRAVTGDVLAERSELFAAARDGVARDVWHRFLTFLQWVWAWVVTLWVRFIRLITGRRPTGRQSGVTLPGDLPISAGRGGLMSPSVVAEVSRRVRRDETFRDRLRRWWRRLLGREDYAETVQAMMREEAERVRGEHEQEVDAEQATIDEELERIEREARERRRERDQRLEELERKRREALERLAERQQRGAFQEVGGTVMHQLHQAGLVSEGGEPTHALLERFATLMYEDVHRTLPAGGAATPGRYAGGEGEYERGPMRSRNEIGAMELVDSIVRARTNHPSVRHIYDDDVVVHREVRTSKTHVVLIFDHSGSMEEKGRLDAAKRVSLVMHRAVRRADPDHRIDLIAMSTGVEVVDLAGCWNAEPRGFTNHGAAFRLAADLLQGEAADRRIVYLVTDGLPEAYTAPDGQDLADRPEVCMPYAKQMARRLREMAGTRVHVIQLETEDPLFVEAAAELAEAAGGSVEAMDPSDLMTHLVADFEHEAPTA